MRKKSILRKAAWGMAGVAAAGVATSAGLGLAGWALWRGLRTASVAGQVVLITGSSRGLGFAMAQDFARHGAKLVICARDERGLDWARQELTSMGAEVLAVRCDVTNSNEVENMVQQATSHFGRVDILINNAGIISVGPLESQTLADFQESMNVMFWGAVYPTMAVLPQMMARRSGRIANVTSIGGKVSVPHLLPYNCAKFAAVGFSEGLHAEVSKYGIHVTTVVPGLMRVGSHLNAYFKGKHQAEFTWFSMGATLPLISISGRRAARKIVRAVRSGRSELIITPQARLAAMFNGLFPGLMSDLLGIVNRLLPSADGAGLERRTGKESETPLTRSVLTELGRRAGHHLHQFPERDLTRRPGIRFTPPGVAEVS
jgi:NAD(P)-dependent dehydrogenase (short-subunit alcohol dehydrogenase family)